MQDHRQVDGTMSLVTGRNGTSVADMNGEFIRTNPTNQNPPETTGTDMLENTVTATVLTADVASVQENVLQRSHPMMLNRNLEPSLNLKLLRRPESTSSHLMMMMLHPKPKMLKRMKKPNLRKLMENQKRLRIRKIKLRSLMINQKRTLRIQKRNLRKQKRNLRKQKISSRNQKRNFLNLKIRTLKWRQTRKEQKSWFLLKMMKYLNSRN